MAKNFKKNFKFKRARREKIKIAAIFLGAVFLLGGIYWTVSFFVQFDLSQSRAEAISFLMQKMKTRGCIADGILTGSGDDTDGSIALIERSRCEYLHRAIETWTSPPNFELIALNKNKFRKEYIYGMFLAEAIGVNSKYYYPEERRNFDFSKMCHANSEGFWGPGTCKADMDNKEYQKYLKYITRQAVDLGIQTFMFGQIHFQDIKKTSAKKIVSEMRDYAKSKGMDIVIGAQTNNITDEKYLKLFDYIEGGVGMDEKGNIEDGPCWSKLGGCWALLWHENFSSKANNVLLHLDWSGLDYDDMSKFARMDKATREKTLSDLYHFFTRKNMGFLLPFLTVIYDKNGGCYGPKANYYSPDNRYSCKDEAAIDFILQGKKIGNDAQFVSQTVPSVMVSGNEYSVSVTLKNSGSTEWSGENGYGLAAQNPRENNFWGDQIKMGKSEKIKPGETKNFIFKVKAPAPGVYNFQWMMAQKEVGFGEQTENRLITVNP